MKYKTRFAENGEQILMWEEDVVKEYIDDCIREHRLAKDPRSQYYLDAYQAMRMTLFGEYLPRDDGKPVIQKIE